MKFGKEFKKQMVPEWTEAYMDYNGLKRILQDVLRYKQSKQLPTPMRALQQRLAMHRTFSGLNLRPSKVPSAGDIEDQVINVGTSHQEGSRQFYRTEFLRESEEGGEIEVRFFRKLDEELNKVNVFYKEKVEAMMDEAAMLNKQMDALIALRVKVANPDYHGRCLRNQSSLDMTSRMPLRNSTQNGMGNVDEKLEVEMSNGSELEESIDAQSGRENMDMAFGVDNFPNYQQQDSIGDPELVPDVVSSCNADCIEKVNVCDKNQDPHEILDRVKINNPLESPISTIKSVFRDSKQEELSFTKEELKKVEDRLRVVFIEFYQKLRILKHYSFVNLSAFSKIMKKYEKITSRRASKSYMKIVDNSYLGSCDEISGLLERVEATVIKHFSNSNRREGMKSLRPKARKEKHLVTFLSGFFSGCSIALIVAVVLRIESINLIEKKESASYMVNIFPLYSLFAYVVLHMLMYSLNIYFWRRYRVNYPFIFGFKQGTELGYREVFLISTGLAMLALTSFLGNLHLDMGSRTHNYKIITELFPLLLVAIALVVLFCPFNIIYRSSRFFFIKSLFRCVCAPLYKVTLPDFFLADHLTSQVQAIRCVELYICYYCSGEFSRRQNKCQSHGVYTAFYFVVAVIPFWLRFLQCIRRLCEEKDPMHGYNGLKYFLTIVAVLIRSAFELKRGLTWMVLALVSSAVATIMNTYWDIVVDWGLLRRKSKHAYLRDKLVVSHKSVYFGAMVLNIVLRVAWMQLVLEFNLHSLHKMAVVTFFSSLEIIRRGIWSFFRLENEHLNNVGNFRAFKSVPLPFNYYNEDNEKDD